MRLRLKSRRRSQAGFSLLEVTISVLVLVIVMAAVFRQVNGIQKTTKAESMKLDLTQESREFVDQFARDVHMSGFPSPKMNQDYNGLLDHHTASGLVYVSTTHLIFEADVYGDGNVYRVEYIYVASDANDPSCPCLRRAVTAKDSTDATDPLQYGVPTYYTEVQNVIDPTGMTEPIFTYYQATGALVGVDSNACNGKLQASLATPPAPAKGCAEIEDDNALVQSIDAIKVNLSTRTAQYDPQTRAQHVNSITSIAELEN